MNDADDTGRISRRRALKIAGIGLAGTTLAAVGDLAIPPTRAWAKDGGGSGSGKGGGKGGGDGGTAAGPPAGKPDIQYAIGPWTPPPIQKRGIAFALGGPVHTLFLTARLNRLTPGDKAVLAYALDTIEATYAFSPSGVFPMIAYGRPYFTKLRALSAKGAAAVAANMPKDTTTGNEVLADAVLCPTDIADVRRPPIFRPRYNVACVIEGNDILVSLRSDLFGNLTDVERWLKGSNSLAGRQVTSPDQSLLTWTSARALFVQIGLPKKVAVANNLPFAGRINDESPMWFGQADQQTNGAGPPEITAFKGNLSAHITTARPGDYFDNGTIQVLNHNISDLDAWYLDADGGGEFTNRLQLMFRSTHAFGNGGGSPFWPNQFFGTGDAAQGAAGKGTPGKVRRIGHLTALQRSSRATDGTPMHARMDGPGFDGLDVPRGAPVAKLQFSAFVPSGDFFNAMRRNTSALDLVTQNGVNPHDNGIERFITATRRQHFLMPPRRFRAMPLLELA